MAGMRHMKASSPRAIRWRKGELIGAGAYGRVYMGMNLDSGELIAVKQVLVGTNNLAKEKAQAHIRELEEEVKLLQNLSHPNIVRYLGTAREEEALNIFLEFVPGGSIASLLGKFGSFTEPVIRMYTRQLLLGLEYLHKNKIMHRDIKGANILVDNQGHIKLADFGASKKVLELATISEAKSMKGTPYWMAPEVIRQTGHNWQADIWSVGCTVIEMATGKPPWSEQFQEVAALFHIGTTKSHPPIPEHLSQNAKGFLLKCLQREPRVRPSATELLKHPFVREDDQVDNNFVSSAQGQEPCFQESRLSSAHNKNSSSGIASSGVSRIFRDSGFSFAPATKLVASLVRSRNFLSMKKQEASFRDCEDELNCSVRIDSPTRDFSDEVNNSFNPMCEPTSIDCWTNDLNKSPGDISPGIDNKIIMDDVNQMPSFSQGIEDGTNNNVQSPDQTLRNSLPEDDDEVTESKIRAFLDEKALELKKLQTPLYEEFNSIWRVAREEGSENVATSSPGKTRQLVTSSKSPSKGSSMSERSICVRNSVDSETSVSSGSPGGNPAMSVSFSPLLEVPSPKLNEWRGTVQDGHCATSSPSFCERQRQWKEELQMELEMKREEKRKLARHGASPKDKALQRQGSRLGHTPPYSPMR